MGNAALTHPTFWPRRQSRPMAQFKKVFWFAGGLPFLKKELPA
jgi:hypothetical protein